MKEEKSKLMEAIKNSFSLEPRFSPYYYNMLRNIKVRLTVTVLLVIFKTLISGRGNYG
jgi:hypothetical protein